MYCIIEKIILIFSYYKIFDNFFPKAQYNICTIVHIADNIKIPGVAIIN